tara:strand:- start:511 stop:1053 length:543 start_codon:yes stop_codon:yes gene_type:complete
MARTRVPSEQLNFRSANTGTHLLDTYLEDAEKGGLTLSALLSKIFDDATGNIDTFTFTYDNSLGSEKLFLKIGTDGANNEIASFTQLFSDLNNFKATALADMEVKRLDAEQSASEALSSENASETAQTAAETAQAAAEAARDLSQTYANQAFQTTPTVIQQGIIISQLYGGLFNGSTLDA